MFKKMISILSWVMILILVLCSCESSDGSVDGVQSATGETQSVIDSSKTVSAAVDPVPFDVNNYSTWFFADRTDLATPEDAEKINDNMFLEDVVETLGKPQFEYYNKFDQNFLNASDSVGDATGNKFVDKSIVVYKLSDGTVCVVSVAYSEEANNSGASDPQGRYAVLSVELEDVVENTCIARNSSNWFLQDGTVCPSPEEFESVEGMPFDDAIVKLGRARGTRTLFDTGYLQNFVYKLSDGRFGLVGCNKQLKAEIMYYDSCRYIDTSTGKVVSEYVEKDGVRVEVKDK